MTEAEVLAEFRDACALLEGHFILSSGLHSPKYLQCARVMSDPARGERLCAALASKISKAHGDEFDLIVSPAMGGVIVGYETARALGKPSIFCERVDGEFTFRRGFEVPMGARCLMVEDVVTTGLSSRECISAIQEAGGVTVAAAALVDRSGGSADLGVPFTALLALEVPTFKSDALPPELAALQAIKPGSRSLTSGEGR